MSNIDALPYYDNQVEDPGELICLHTGNELTVKRQRKLQQP
jgi:hypothetical protein